MASAKDKALLAAVSAQDVQRVSELLEEGANPGARNQGSWSALHLAAHYGSTEVAERLLDAGADVNVLMVTDELIDRTRYEGSATPLIIARRACPLPLVPSRKPAIVATSSWPGCWSPPARA